MQGYLKDNRTGKDAVYKTFVEIKKTDTTIDFYFTAENSTFYAPFKGFNKQHYLGDVCEAFVSINGSKAKYYEIEVTPNNDVFLAEITNEKGEPPFSSELVKENFVVSKTEKSGDTYKVFFSIPLSRIGYKEGDKIYFNALRMDTDGEVKEKHIFSLSPTFCGTFHIPKYFLEYK